jgi:hypothetical protein
MTIQTEINGSRDQRLREDPLVVSSSYVAGRNANKANLIVTVEKLSRLDLAASWRQGGESERGTRRRNCSWSLWLMADRIVFPESLVSSFPQENQNLPHKRRCSDLPCQRRIQACFRRGARLDRNNQISRRSSSLWTASTRELESELARKCLCAWRLTSLPTRFLSNPPIH